MIRGAKRVKIIFHRVTGFMRVLPDFLIIGVSKAGTTSLYNYLIKNPSIVKALGKEVSFFDDNFSKGISWYKTNFPTFITKNQVKKNHQYFLTGEAADYLYHPLAPKRINEIIPDVKMIALLRNPVDRAHSHYWQSVRKGRETASFKDVIEKQLSDETAFQKDSYLFETSKNLKINPLNAYLSGGIYADRIKRFYDVFNKEQILIIKSEDLFSNPETTVNNVTNFLKIPKWSLKNYPKYNYYKDQSPMDSEIRKRLREYYKPHNESLSSLLGVSFDWNESY